MSTPPPHPPSAPSQRPERFGSGMLRRFGWFYKILGFGRVFAKIRFEDHNAERVRDAARRGPIVYVLLRRSTIDHLALNTVLNRNRLPLSVWSHGALRFFWQPVAEAWAEIFRRLRDRFQRGPAPHPVQSGWLTTLVAAGQPTALFLEDGRDVVPSPDTDPLSAAIQATRRTGRAVQLIPVIVVWDRAPDTHESAALTFLRGSRERPSLFTRLRSLYLPGQAAPFAQVGDPVDVAAFLERVPDDRAVVALRTLLRRYLKRESRTVRGPTILPRATLKAQVLDAPPMRRFAEDHARATHQPLDRVRREMSREFDKIAADFRFGIIRFFSWAMRPLWRRVYSGYEIPDEDLDRIRRAMRDGTAVLVSCHKSHFDYLLLSWVLYHANLITPHIVAGINLAIWPVSRVLRSAGAFFIERSFHGKPVHGAVFSRYLRELLLHGYTVEFFIEGGRTRTGRLLPAKRGVLEMILESASHAPRGHEITLLPIAISYEQVAEEKSYQSELQGADKRKEDVRELIKARSVLRNRYGRVFVRVGEPIRASEVFRPHPPGSPTWEQAVQDTGDELVQRIGKVVTVLPTSVVALALMAHHRTAIPAPDLAARVDRLIAWLARRNAVLTPMVAQHPEAARARALSRFQQAGHVRVHDGAESRIWEIVPDHRPVLDFHKNQVMQHFIAGSMVSAVLHGMAGVGPFHPDDLEADLARLRGLWARELTLAPGLTDRALLEEGLRDLSAHGTLHRGEDGSFEVVDPTRIGEVHGLVRALLESYLIVCLGVLEPDARAADIKAWTKRLANQQGARLAEGLITRPEAFATVPLTNALKTLVAQGAMRSDGGALVAERAAVEAIVAWLRPMVEPPPRAEFSEGPA